MNVRLGMLAGLLVAGVGSALETLWLMASGDSRCGVVNEGWVMLGSFAAYLVLGALMGGAVGLLSSILRRGRRPTPARSFITSCAGVVALLVAAGLLVYTFAKFLPNDVGFGDPAGLLALAVIIVLTLAGFAALRWALMRVAGKLAERLLAGRRALAVAVATVALVAAVSVAYGLVTSPHDPLTQLVGASRAPGEVGFLDPERSVGASGRPNVVLITLDTVRAANLELHGYERRTAPCLTEFAKTAVVHDRAYSHSSWTLPGHQILFTGRYPSELSEQWGGDSLSESHVTLAEVLRADGYRTGAVVGGPLCMGNRGFSQGFDYYEDRLPVNTPFLSQIINRLVPNLFSSAGKRRSDQLNDFAFRWLDENADGPFFLFLNYFDPHLRLNPPFPERLAFEGAYDPFRGMLMSQGDMEIGLTTGRRSLSETERRHWVALYDGEILFLDRQVGRLLEKLREVGAYDSTMIVITSDHGHSYGEHGLAGHGGWIFEEAVHVPLVVRHPGGRDGGTRVSERIGLVHVTPMILSELGLGPTTMHASLPERGGEPLVLENGRWNIQSYLDFSYSGKNLRAVFGDRYKLVTIDGEAAELYDLESDPGELENLISARPAVAESLRLLLDDVTGEMLEPPPPAEEGVLDPDVQERLRAVGYL